MSEEIKMFTGLFKRLVCILICLLFFVKTGTCIYVPPQHKYCASPIEFVVSEKRDLDFGFYAPETLPAQTSDFDLNQFLTYKIKLFHYQNYVLVQIKSSDPTFANRPHLTSFLQMKYIWYQSTGEDPLRLG